MHKKSKIKISPILTLIFVLTTLYLIFAIYGFSGVENGIRFAIIGLLILIDIVLLYFMYNSRNKRSKKKKELRNNIIKIIFIVLFLFLGFNLNKVMSYFSKVNKKVTYSVALVTLKENNDTNLSTIKNKKMGIIDDENQEDGYKLAQKIISENKLLENNTLEKYSEYTALIDALYKKEVDYIFLPASYEDVYSTKEEYEDIAQRVKTVTTTSKETTKKDANLLGTGKDITKPFTVLLMGIDSTKNGLEHSDSFNGDTLILVTFNPKTLTATMLSIHRDTYVPISCYSDKHETKINASAAKGTKCAIETIQDYLDVTIDYYVKINFTGLVDLVDTLGGVEVDVPYALCEQDSKRRFKGHMVYIEQGHQTLNGEQALAFARNRKANEAYCPAKYTKVYRSVELRGENQQKVILAVLEKLKKFKDITKVYDLLDVVSNNVDTNMTKDTILSFYNVAKDVMTKSKSDSVIQIQKLDIKGDGQNIYDEASKLVLWNYIPHKQSVELVKAAMKENLEITPKTMSKEFAFDSEEGYKEHVIGRNITEGFFKYDLLPSFVGNYLSEAKAWAKSHNIKLEVTYTDSTSKRDGLIYRQEEPAKKRINRLTNNTAHISVYRNPSMPEPKTNTSGKPNCLIEDNNEACILPDLIGKDRTYFNEWGSKFANNLNFDVIYDPESTEKQGTIIKQSFNKGTTVKNIIESKETLYITIAGKKQ